MDQTQIRALLQQHLRKRGIKLTDELTFDLVERAIASSGVGLDHALGEHVLAIGDYSMHHDLTIFFMVTDRRVAGRRGRIFFHAPLTEITQVVDRTNLVTANLKIHLSSSHIADATVGSFTKALGAYLTALSQIPPLERVPAPIPLPTPTLEELSSPEWVQSIPDHLSGACEQMLSLVSARFRRGQISIEAARNLVPRIFLQNRNALYGRGMQSSWWLSPLTVSDLGEIIQWMLGQPVAKYQQENLYTYDFATGQKSNAGRAAASTAVGLAAAGLLGFGWVSIAGKTLRNIRTMLSGAPGMTYLGVQGLQSTQFEPLSALQPEVMNKLLQTLTRSEESLLYRRIAYGWEASAEELMSKTDQEVQSQSGNLTASA